MRRDAAAIDQQGFGRAADAGAPHLGVQRDLARHREIGGAVDIGVAEPVEMRDHRHAALGLHTRDQRLAAARHDHVDDAGRGQHVADGGAILGRPQLDRCLGQPGGAKPPGETRSNRGRGVKAFRAGAEDRRVPRLEAERTGVRGHVRTRLEDDSDHAQGHAHALEAETVRPRPRLVGRADRIEQGRHVLDAPGDRLDALGIERQSIEEGRGGAAGPCLGDVLGVGVQDLRRGRADRGSGGDQRLVLRLRRREREDGSGLAGIASETLHRLGDVVALAALGGHDCSSTMSSRWIISSRPRYPRMVSMSPLLCPLMRFASAAE